MWPEYRIRRLRLCWSIRPSRTMSRKFSFIIMLSTSVCYCVLYYFTFTMTDKLNAIYWYHGGTAFLGGIIFWRVFFDIWRSLTWKSLYRLRETFFSVSRIRKICWSRFTISLWYWFISLNIKYYIIFNSRGRAWIKH